MSGKGLLLEYREMVEQEHKQEISAAEFERQKAIALKELEQIKTKKEKKMAKQDGPEVNQHKRMAMGAKITGKKEGGKVEKKKEHKKEHKKKK